jgi:hypothetical protein
MRKTVKTNAPKWVAVSVLVFAVTIGSWLGKLKAQQMQSGGSAVTISNIPHVVVDTAPTTAVTGTFWQATQPTSLASLPALAAGTAKIGVTYPYTSCGTTAYTAALQAAPTASTVIAPATTCVLVLNLSNTSAGALNITVTDNQGTPVPFLNAVTLNAGETRTYPFAPGGAKFTSGIKMQASGVGIVYSAEGLQ